MRFPFFRSAVALCALPFAALAFAAIPFAASAEFAGGRVGVSHSFHLGDTSEAKSGLDGQFEWAFGSSFRMQTDIGYSGLHALDDKALNLTNHLGFTLANGGTLGAFYGWDRISGTEDFFGLEYAGDVGAARIDSYVAMIDEPGSNGRMAGIAARMQMNDAMGLGASIDYMKSDGVADATRFGLSADYMLGASSRVKGELGRVSADDAGGSVDETYLKLGVDFKFGANGGPSFGTRSLLNALPGL